MIALYQAASARVPESVPLAFALGRVYFEIAMLDEAADQFQKVEVREPNLPGLHAVLGAIFERRGQTAEAFDEYRRALTLGGAFDWPNRCAACGVGHGRWTDRCPSSRGWNPSRPQRFSRRAAGGRGPSPPPPSFCRRAARWPPVCSAPAG